MEKDVNKTKLGRGGEELFEKPPVENSSTELWRDRILESTAKGRFEVSLESGLEEAWEFSGRVRGWDLGKTRKFFS